MFLKIKIEEIKNIQKLKFNVKLKQYKHYYINKKSIKKL